MIVSLEVAMVARVLLARGNNHLLNFLVDSVVVALLSFVVSLSDEPSVLDESALASVLDALSELEGSVVDPSVLGVSLLAVPDSVVSLLFAESEVDVPSEPDVSVPEALSVLEASLLDVFSGFDALSVLDASLPDVFSGSEALSVLEASGLLSGSEALSVLEASGFSVPDSVSVADGVAADVLVPASLSDNQ